MKKNFGHISPQFRRRTSFCGQKDVFLTVFGQFEQIWPFDPVNLVFTHKKYTWGDSVVKVDNAEKHFLWYLTSNSTYDVILWSKWRHFCRFRTISTVIWNFYPFKLVFTHKKVYVNLLNIMSKCSLKIFWHILSQFWRMTSFCGQKDVLVTIFGQFGRIYVHKMTSYFEIGVRCDKKFSFDTTYSYYWVTSCILL